MKLRYIEELENKLLVLNKSINLVKKIYTDSLTELDRLTKEQAELVKLIHVTTAYHKMKGE